MTENRTKVHSLGELYPDAKDRVAGQFIEIRFVMAKKCQFVAWTQNGQVKMIPSLVADMAEPYVQRIQDIREEPRARGEEAETQQLLRLSRAHETLARFFMRVGYWEDAFLQYTEAALTVTNVSDELWNDAEVGFLLHTPLEHRFLAMFNSCRQIAEEHPAIKGSVQWQRLLHKWQVVTDVHRKWSAERREITQIARAWKFGGR